MAEQAHLPAPWAAPGQPRGFLVVVRLDHAALHVYPIGPGFRSDWRCSFPYELREQAGVCFLVQRLTLISKRRYYRASGRIWRVESGRAVEEVTPPRRRQKGQTP